MIVPQVRLSGQPGAVRGVEPKVWQGRNLALSPEEYCRLSNIYAFVTFYIYIAAPASQRC